MVVPQHQILEGGKIFEAEALIACNEKLLKYGAKSKLRVESSAQKSLKP